MQKELCIHNQLIHFTLLSASNEWRGALSIDGIEHKVGLDELNTDSVNNVNWEKIEKVLQIIMEKYPVLLEKSHKVMNAFVKETGLTHYVKLGPLQKLEWAFIKILFPLESRVVFRLYFLPDNIDWIDPYGRWQVTFEASNVIDVDRIQQ